MKRLLLIIGAALLLGSCNKPSQFTVNLNFDNSDGQFVCLYKYIDNKEILVDTATLVNGIASLTANADNPELQYFIEINSPRSIIRYDFFTDNHNITITGDLKNDNRNTWIVKGSKSMDLYIKYTNSLQSLRNTISELESSYCDAYQTNDSVKIEEIRQQIFDTEDQRGNILPDFIKKHPKHFLSQYLLSHSTYRFDYDEFVELASLCKKESIYSKKIKEYIEHGKPVEMFIDFTLQTADGKDINLAETIKNNKYTLIDFWASWCGPCRGEFPYLKDAYNRHHENGLEIISVNVDKNREDWLKALEENSLPWINVRDTDKTIRRKYQAYGIPAIFLYDQNGVLIAKDLRHFDLDYKMTKLLK